MISTNTPNLKLSKMRKSIIPFIFLIFLLSLIVSCEKEEDPQKELIKNLVGDYIDTEWTIYTVECVITYCEWVADTLITDDPGYNFKIVQIENNKIEIILSDGAKLYAQNFIQASNAIAGQIPLQNQNFYGDIMAVKGYEKWTFDNEYYSISYQNNIIDIYFILEDAVLFNIQGIKK